MLDEVLEFRVEWIEHQLAHQVKDPNGRAYNRTAFLPQRREMMQRWADYLDRLRSCDPAVTATAAQRIEHSLPAGDLGVTVDSSLGRSPIISCQ
jgi:hypothetical protein